MVPAKWMEVLAAWDVVEPRVKYNSCDALKERAKNHLLSLFSSTGRGALSLAIPCFDDVAGGVAVLDFPRSEMCARIQALRFAWREAPLVLISDNEYLRVHSPEREGAPCGPVL